MIITILIFLVVLSVLVFAHELGHFWTAKSLGIRAEEFGFGFPPRIFGFQIIKGGKFKKWRWVRGNRPLTEEDAKHGTVYSLNWIPIGGFVKIKGEGGDNKADRDSFASRSIWQRFLIMAAGVFMNIVLAFVLFSIAISIGMPQEITGPGGNIQIEQVVDKSPAAAAGISMGDIVVGIDNKTFPEITDLQAYISGHQGQEMAVELKRGETSLTKEVTPEVMAGSDKAVIGVALSKTEIIRYKWYQAIAKSAVYTIQVLGSICVAFYDLIKNLILGHNVGDAVGGPVRIAQITGQVASIGFVYLLNFMALLSLNLAVINFLPFPPLDGGRVLFLLIESIRRKPVKQEIETILNNIGFLLLMALLVWVTFKDLWRVFH